MPEPRIKLRLAPATVLVAGALVALAAWPVYLGARASAAAQPVALLTPAPVKRDWRVRDANITFLESRAGKVRGDMLTPRLLSGEYLQRYRERGDLGDVLRAEHAARVSLAAMPRRNVAGEAALASALLTLHRFREAKAAIVAARRTEPDNAGLAAEEAALDLELGDVNGARRLIGAHRGDPAFDVVAARLREETGHLADARALVGGALRRADAIYDTPAERRAWFHARAAELAFEAGDHDAARRGAQDGLAVFPGHLRALTILARVALAEGKNAEAEDAARRAAAIQPNPEVLGMLADAQAARGANGAAAATRDEIFAVARIGDALHVNDRLMAVYEADHGVRVDDAYAIAKRELTVRDDVYAEDTLAWAAARSGHWDVARTAIARALRYGIEDPRIRAHAEKIAAHAPG
ncbi:MAG TPA: tetratricopeptide repeat protein [Candidatus Elarobacter sp.]|jgi:tetratricopeptide (TPR) repeat protein